MKPTYAQMVSLILRINEEECEEMHPENCDSCHLFWSGLCNEIEQFADKLMEE